MTDAEKAALKAFAHDVVDKHLPAVIEAEIAKLPAPYAGILQAVEAALKAELTAKLDEAIDAKLA